MEEVRLSVKEATKLRDSALNITKSLCRDMLTFAEMLSRIKYGLVRMGRGEVALVHAWGYESFEAYVEKELRYHYGTANAYVRIHTLFFVLLDGVFSREELEEVGITNLRCISKVATPQNVKWWVKQAKNKTCCQLHEMVEKERDGTGRVFPVKTFTTIIRASKIKKLRKDLEFLQAQYGTKSLGEALVKCVEDSTRAHKLKPNLRAVG